MTNREPDELLQSISRSILLKALAVSLAIHAVVVFGTSFGLYRDWAVYGVHTPSTIKGLKQKAQKDADEAARRQAAEEKAAAAAADAATNAPPAAAPSASVTPPPTEASPTPQAPEVAPMPPKPTFTLGEDLSLE